MAKLITTDNLLDFGQQLAAKEDILLAGKVDKISGKQLSTNDYTTAEKTKLAGLNNYTHPTTDGNKHVPPTGTTNNGKVLKAGATAGALSWENITKGEVGLSNVDNTSDLNKPISTATQTALNAKANSSHQHGNADITALDASKLTGTVSIDRLPKGALERCVIVADDTARKALTTAQVQTGDTVKVTSTGLMYFIVDDTKLSTDAGYEVYTAGSATSVPWSGVTSKPSTFPPSSHTHDDRYFTEVEVTTKLAGKVDAVSGKGLSTNDYTTAEKTKLAGLSNYTHPAYTSKASGLYKVTVDATGHVSQTVAVAKADITALGIPAQDTTYGNMKGASASAAGGAGLVPAPASGKQTSFLRGDGTWVVPTNTTYGLVTQSANGLMSATDKVKLDGMTYASDADIDSIITEIFG